MARAKFDADHFRTRWLELHHSYEQQAYRLFKNALDKQIKAVITEIKERGVFGIEAFVESIVKNEPMSEAYLKVYRLIGVKHARFTFNWIREVAKQNEAKRGNIFGSDFFDKLMIEYFREFGALQVVEVDQTTISHIQLLLQRGRDLNYAGSQLADYMVTELNNPDYNRNRAMRIARTETTSAANRGAFLAGQNSEYETANSWISAEGSRTRKSHHDQNGKIAKEGKGKNKFKVAVYKGKVRTGYDLMNHPGDTTAHVSNLANCRCSSAFVPVLDKYGLPILK